MKDKIDIKLKQSDFSGVVMIKKDDEILFQEAYGYAERTFKVKNTVNTKFRIASISKMFTAVCILQLIEENRLQFDSKIKDFIDLKETSILDAVNIFQLLTHTSGIGDYFDEINDDWESLWKDKPIYNTRNFNDYFEMFSHKEQKSKPGEKFYYNNAGYILLGMVIEKVTGTNYFQYVEELILKPLGMKDTSFLALDDVNENVAYGYEKVKKEDGTMKWMNNYYTITPEGSADGGATSTANDLLIFMKALKEGKLLSQEMTEAFFTPQVVEEEKGYRDYKWMYGYANNFVLENNKIVRGGHTGEEYGVSCRLYYYPEINVELVILSNIGLTAGKIGWEIGDILFETLL